MQQKNGRFRAAKTQDPTLRPLASPPRRPADGLRPPPQPGRIRPVQRRYGGRVHPDAAIDHRGGRPNQGAFEAAAGQLGPCCLPRVQSIPPWPKAASNDGPVGWNRAVGSVARPMRELVCESARGAVLHQSFDRSLTIGLRMMGNLGHEYRADTSQVAYCNSTRYKYSISVRGRGFCLRRRRFGRRARKLPLGHRDGWTQPCSTI